MRRWIVRAAIGILAVGIVLFVLDRVSLLVWLSPDAPESMAPTLPACGGRLLVDGITYERRDPRRGEIVAVHARATPDGRFRPDPGARQHALVLRVMAVPGDQVLGRNGRVFVNGLVADDIQTAPFRRVDVAGDQFFLLGDNRAGAEDSRHFGVVRRGAIFGRVVLVVWPLGDLGRPGARRAGAPPGPGLCD
jgi:signal peptidase I